MKKTTIMLLLALCFAVPACAGRGGADNADNDKREAKHSQAKKNPRVINGHEYVEIGGIKWATMNVGATTVAGNDEVAAPDGIGGTFCSCYGTYFKWGETSPSTHYGWEYRPALAEGDNPVLSASHDAATAVWGDGWRTPTKQDVLALYVACGGSQYSNGTCEMHNLQALTDKNKDSRGIYLCAADQTVAPEYKVAGVLFVQDAKHKLFCPAAGSVLDTTLTDAGITGCYWSSSLCTADTGDAHAMYVGLSKVLPEETGGRYLGFTIRPVAD